MKLQTLALENIRCDMNTQSRLFTDQRAIGEYAEAMLAGKPFDAVDVFFDGTNYILAHGFHRIRAAKDAELETFEARVYEGGVAEAQIFSAASNLHHGVKRTPADKTKAVNMMLDNPKVQAEMWPASKIAEHCDVDPKFVAAVENRRMDIHTSPGKVRDSLGRLQPAKKARRKQTAPTLPPVEAPNENSVQSSEKPLPDLQPQAPPLAKGSPSVNPETAEDAPVPPSPPSTSENSGNSLTNSPFSSKDDPSRTAPESQSREMSSISPPVESEPLSEECPPPITSNGLPHSNPNNDESSATLSVSEPDDDESPEHEDDEALEYGYPEMPTTAVEVCCFLLKHEHTLFHDEDLFRDLVAAARNILND